MLFSAILIGMRPRVQWALLCRDVTMGEGGLTMVSELVHVLPVQAAPARLWLVASIAGAPDRTVPVTVRICPPRDAPVVLPPRQVTFGPDGFVELKAALPPVSLATPGTFSVDLSLTDDGRSAERVAVRIAC